MAHLLIKTCLKSMVRGVCVPIDIPNEPVRLVNLCIDRTPSGWSASGETGGTKSVACGDEAARKQQSEAGRLNTLGHVAVIAARQIVDPVRADVTHRQRQRRRKLALHVKVPFFHVIPVRMCLNGGRGQLTGGDSGWWI